MLSTIFYSSTMINKYFPVEHGIYQNVLRNYPGIKEVVYRMVHFVIVVTAGYATMIPVSIGIYVTFHEWVQFRILNDDLRRNLWQEQINGEMFSTSKQREIYGKIRSAVKLHLHIKR